MHIVVYGPLGTGVFTFVDHLRQQNPHAVIEGMTTAESANHADIARRRAPANALLIPAPRLATEMCKNTASALAARETAARSIS